jgi:acyl dehydratase
MKIAEFSQFVGKEIGVSRWFSISQDRIRVFAEVTEDRQGIHVDEIAAAKSPFGSTIAHGFLLASLLSAMLGEVLPPFEDRAFAMNYGFDKLRFVSPVPVNARVRGRFILTEVQIRPSGDQMNRFAVNIEIEGEAKPAMAADWLTIERPAAT